ncbi:cysteate racemase [Acidaminobacterium chupaoyuni]
MQEKKAIGILGGMGPLATADLFKKIVLMTKVTCDNDHIHIYIDNNSKIPDRTTAILCGGTDPVPAMGESAQKLNQMGADVLIMPCNTAHYFLDRIKPFSKAPFISILEQTALRCRQLRGQTPVGLLGTTGTINTGIYKRELEAHGIPCIEPNEEQKELLMELIFAVKAGSHDLDRPAVEAMLAEMKSRGAEYFILGCTELPIVAEWLDLKEDFIDPTTELARAAIEYCGYEVAE